MEKIKENLDGENNLEFYRNQFIEITKKQSDPHFEKINPGDLTGEDLLIFKDFLDDNLTIDQFEEYRQKFITLSMEESNINSSFNFAGWLSNRLGDKRIREKIK
jgi:hypothetical protein